MSFMVHFACLEDFWHVKTGCPGVSIESYLMLFNH
jgi:hypothetical protein